MLGFYLTGHPLEAFSQQLERYADCSVAELGERFAAGTERATVGGLVNGLKVMSIKKEGRNHGRQLAVFRLEEANGAVRVVAFPDVFDTYGRLLEDGAAVIVVASLKGDGDHVELMADEIVALDGIDSRRAAALRVVLDLDEMDEERLDAIREYLLAHPGDMPVRFELRRRGRVSGPPGAASRSDRGSRDRSSRGSQSASRVGLVRVRVRRQNPQRQGRGKAATLPEESRELKEESQVVSFEF